MTPPRHPTAVVLLAPVLASAWLTTLVIAPDAAGAALAIGAVVTVAVLIVRRERRIRRRAAAPAPTELTGGER